MNTTFREKLKIKTYRHQDRFFFLTHPDTGYLDLIKLEVLVREISDLRNQEKT